MSGSVSLVNGHIDPVEKGMSPQEALAWVEDYEKAIKEEQAIVNNGDEFHVEALKVCEVVKQALEKQIPKKPEKNEYNYFICPCCNSDDYSLMHDSNYADRYNYCHNCGQALDWGDTE